MACMHRVLSDGVLYEFGQRLRHLRQARQLRQIDMENFGLSYKYYQRLEAGRVNPTLLTLCKLAQAFEISMGELFCPGHHRPLPLIEDL